MPLSVRGRIPHCFQGNVYGHTDREEGEFILTSALIGYDEQKDEFIINLVSFLLLFSYYLVIVISRKLCALAHR